MNSFRYNYKTDEKIYINDKEIPLIVLLYFLELIALNEDIKYFSGGYNPSQYKKITNPEDINDKGRENNLLTMIHIIAIKRLNLENSVFLLGNVNNPLKYFLRADVFVLASSVEGLPNVLVEAMLCGCTPVSTNCPTGPKEVLQDGKY